MLFERIPSTRNEGWELGDELALTIHPGELVVVAGSQLPTGRHVGVATAVVDWGLVEAYFQALDMVFRFASDVPVASVGREVLSLSGAVLYRQERGDRRGSLDGG